MAITFNSIQDPYGIRQAGSVLAQTLLLNNQQKREDNIKSADLRRQEKTGSILSEVIGRLATQDSPPSILDIIKTSQDAISQGADPKTTMTLLGNYIDLSNSQQKFTLDRDKLVSEQSERENFSRAINGLTPQTSSQDFIGNISSLKPENQLKALKIYESIRPQDANISSYQQSLIDYRTNQTDVNRQNVKLQEAKFVQPYINTLEQEDKRAQTTLDAVNELEKILKNPQSDLGILNSLAQGTVFEGLLSQDAARFNFASKELISDFKRTFGSRITDTDLRLIESILPNVRKSREANLGILDIVKKQNRLAGKRKEIADDIIEKNQGYAPGNLQSRVSTEFNKRYGKQTDQLLEEVRTYANREGTTTTTLLEGEVQLTGPDGRSYAVPVNLVEEARTRGFR